MKSLILLVLSMIITGTYALAQVGISTDNSAPDQTAMLDVKSTTKGALLPRMTQAQIAAILNPANGLQVFCTTSGKMFIYVVTVGQWKEVAYGTEVILPPYSCGTPVTINHAAGSVSPVSKTVTYGTISNIPGEPLKCWITSNLGSDHQATAVNDATESSAGWYWQFNRKQGYKNDGTVLTPSWTITTISEDLDWQSANDPCTLELGSGWRLPSYTEWNNVQGAGGWSTWEQIWNSNLKLHAAGYLKSSDGGAIYNRGSYGRFWTSTQSTLHSNGWCFHFASLSNMMDFTGKANGFSVRCLRAN
jgi:uncharacterized protein (TIGR02145 family)